jgi:NAD(P)-dependent dehydrogenase (short-subunit alcohol dehydrogenase family)
MNFAALYADRTAVVVGCASGIGEATARRLLEFGARVHGLDRKTPAFACASFTEVDLAVPTQIERAADALPKQVDALFNCAGISPTREALAICKVNFLGVRAMTERVIERMAKGAAIVSTSSNAGLGWRAHRRDLGEFLDQSSFAQGLAWLEPRLGGIANAYAFAKEALTVWTLRMSQSLIGRGIRINCTSPGAVQTPMLEEIERTIPTELIDATTQPIGRRSTPTEQIWPLLFLNSDWAAYVNGVDFPVDGGFAARLEIQANNPV